MKEIIGIEKVIKNLSVSLILVIIFIISLIGKVYADDNLQIKEFTEKDISSKIIQEEWGNSVDTVIILNGKAVIDGILATPLSNIYNAPVLLTDKQNLKLETKQQLSKLKMKNIIIIGGENIVSTNVVKEIESILDKVNIERIGGNDRYETSLLIAKKIDSQFNVEKVYVGYGNSEADLISIASKSGEEKSPIILTEKEYVPNDIYEWLTKEKLSNAYFIGGEAVISNKVISSINNITSNDVMGNRVWGNNRFETNGKVLEKFYSNKQVNSILVSNVSDYEISLISIPLGIKLKSPLVLVEDNGLNNIQMNVLSKKRTNKIYRLGNKVNDKIINEIKECVKYNPLVDNNKSKDVLFFIPHQDDEVLSFGTTIKKYIDSGFNVNVVLMTDGSSVGMEKILNGEQICKVHQRKHNPQKEGYKLDGVSIDKVRNDQIIKYRNEEYIRALTQLGLRKEQIHFSSFMQKDLYLEKSIAIKGMIEYLNIYPDATVHTFYNKEFNKENHTDHIGLGKAAKELYDNKKIEKLYFHIEPYWYKDFIKSNTNIQVYVQYANNKSEKNSVVNAAKEYSVWKPEEGKLAVGYHSVKKLLDKFMENPVNYFIEIK